MGRSDNNGDREHRHRRSSSDRDHSRKRRSRDHSREKEKGGRDYDREKEKGGRDHDREKERDRQRREHRDRDKERHRDKYKDSRDRHSSSMEKERHRKRDKDNHRERNRGSDKYDKKYDRNDPTERDKVKDEKKRASRNQSHASDSDDLSRKDDRRHSSSHRKTSQRYKKSHHRHKDKDEKKHKSHRESSSSSSKRKKKHEKQSSTAESKKIKIHIQHNLEELGPFRNQTPSSLLDTEQDYFEYHSHLRLYLYYHQQTYFEDLTSDKTRSSFSSFVKKYNKGLLPTIFYKLPGELPAKILQECKRTQHTWSFNTTKGESATLNVIKEGVRKQTEYSGRGCTVIPPSSATSHHLGSTPLDTTAAQKQNTQSSKERTPFDRRANKRLQNHIKNTYEELTGIPDKPTSVQERREMYRTQQAEKQHGASRQNDELRMGGVELQDKDIYGDREGDSFRKALSREKERNAKRMDKKKARAGELQQKEDERKKAMLDMLGLGHIKSGGRIQIAPRTDG